MAKSNSFFNIDMLVLSLLKVSDCYGYELVKKIKEVSNNTLDIKDITLEFVVRAETQEELLNYQRIINKTFNPTLGEGTLCYKDISK